MEEGRTEPWGRRTRVFWTHRTIGDATTPAEMIRHVREFVDNCKVRQFSFNAADLAAEISLGVTVGDSKQYAAFVDLSPSDMVALGSLGLGLSVAAYPTSDEANDTDDAE